MFHSQHYSVATVIHIQSLNSQVCVCIHTHIIFTIQGRWSDKRNKKTIGAAMNAVLPFPYVTLDTLAIVSSALDVGLYHIKTCLQLKATLLFTLLLFAFMCTYIRATFILQMITVIVDRQGIHIRRNCTCFAH